MFWRWCDMSHHPYLIYTGKKLLEYNYNVCRKFIYLFFFFYRQSGKKYSYEGKVMCHAGGSYESTLTHYYCRHHCAALYYYLLDMGLVTLLNFLFPSCLLSHFYNHLLPSHLKELYRPEVVFFFILFSQSLLILQLLFLFSRCYMVYFCWFVISEWFTTTLISNNSLDHLVSQLHSTVCCYNLNMIDYDYSYWQKCCISL